MSYQPSQIDHRHRARDTHPHRRGPLVVPILADKIRPTSPPAMPIRILNSGVDLGADPNTCSTVVFRDHSGVVCRTSANPHQHRKTRRQSQQQLARKAMQDTGGRGGGGGGGGVASSVIAPGCERQLTPVGAAPVGVGVGDGIEGGGRASSPYDMTSIFGLEVTSETSKTEWCKMRSRKRSLDPGNTPRTVAIECLMFL